MKAELEILGIEKASMSKVYADPLLKRTNASTEKALPFLSVLDFATKSACCCLAGSVKINCFQRKRKIKVRKTFFVYA